MVSRARTRIKMQIILHLRPRFVFAKEVGWKSQGFLEKGSFKFQGAEAMFFESGQGKERMEVWSNGVQGKNQKQNKSQTWGKARGLEVK